MSSRKPVAFSLMKNEEFSGVYRVFRIIKSYISQNNVLFADCSHVSASLAPLFVRVNAPPCVYSDVVAFTLKIDLFCQTAANFDCGLAKTDG